MQMGNAIPNDWTGGTGLIPSGGVINVPAEPFRISIFIQNQSTTGAITITFSAISPGTATSSATKETNGTAVNAVVKIPANSTIPLNLGVTGFGTTGAFTVSGTAGQPVCVLTA